MLCLNHIAILVLSLIGLCRADSITPSNATILSSTNGTVYVSLSRSNERVATVQALALTLSGQNPSISGGAFLALPSNSAQLTSSQIAFISCDPSAYDGFLSAASVFAIAQEKNAAAVVFYTATSDWCKLEVDGRLTYQPVYSLNSRNGTAMARGIVSNSAFTATVSINAADPRATNSTSGGDSGTGPLGPSPSTAVAMIVLYAITGVITLLFVLIISTGVIRARRYPERYGPRAAGGRSGQTRAGGLARAVLDSIPVVKFGEREQPKPTDVELAHTETTRQAEHTPMPETTPSATTATVEASPVTTQEGIAAASSTVPTTQAVEGVQGCSICTEDFEVGQDQRVLPCDHRFHPACVDPWLLNVSGTCPLCRIDLRPPSAADAQDDASSPDSAPPTDRRRRSVLLAITGLRRPDGMTRDERISALRLYRQTHRNESTLEEDPTSADPHPSADEQVGSRQRLSRLFNVRTWRTTT